jgi:hypothetical protein
MSVCSLVPKANFISIHVSKENIFFFKATFSLLHNFLDFLKNVAFSTVVKKIGRSVFKISAALSLIPSKIFI